jgi:hypothetical protein
MESQSDSITRFISVKDIVCIHPEVLKKKKKARHILEFKRIPQDDNILKEMGRRIKKK